MALMVGVQVKKPPYFLQTDVRFTERRDLPALLDDMMSVLAILYACPTHASE